jgi:hypothetical protein
VQNLKAEYEAEAQGWRQGIAEKAKAELARKECELRRQLEAERDAQIKLVRFLYSVRLCAS